ncbi:MAG: hypothetical protein ACFFD2_03690 [Promethearchaeota archaeon]
MKEIGRNIQYEIDGNTLRMEINLNPKEKPPSKSGKSLIIASSHGNKRLIQGQEIFLGLNLYEKVKKEVEKPEK